MSDPRKSTTDRVEENYKLMRDISVAFGECTALYECCKVEELIESYLELQSENPGVFVLYYWLDIQLRVEDAGGTPTAMINQARGRLWTVLNARGLRRLKESEELPEPRRCDCENDSCKRDHQAGDCQDPAGVPVTFGQLCLDCAVYMPAEFRAVAQ